MNGTLLWEDARAGAVAAVLGRWAFVQTGAYNYEDGWAVNLDTGEERFRGCEPGGEAAPGVFIINHTSSPAVPPSDPPCLVDAQLKILRRFEGYTTLRRRIMGMSMPGYLALYAVDRTVRLYDLLRDEILPGSLSGLVDPQQGLAQLWTREGSAVFRLDTRERVSDWDNGVMPCEYIAYGPEFRVYEETNLRDRKMEYYAVQDGETRQIQYAVYTAGGYYLEELDGSARLLEASGRLLQTLDPHPGATVTSNAAWQDTTTLPNLTLRLWQGGYELIGKTGVVLQGETEGYAGLECFSQTRYALYTEYCEKSRFSLLTAEGEVLLEGLDKLLATEVPGIWAVQQGFTVGLMDENGSWLWSMDVSP